MKAPVNPDAVLFGGRVELNSLLRAYPCEVIYCNGSIEGQFGPENYERLRGEVEESGGRPTVLVVTSDSKNSDEVSVFPITLNRALAFDESVMVRHADFIETCFRAVNFVQTANMCSETFHGTHDIEQLLPAILSMSFSAIRACNLADFNKTIEILSYLFGYIDLTLIEIEMLESEQAKMQQGTTDPHLEVMVYQEGPTLH